MGCSSREWILWGLYVVATTTGDVPGCERESVLDIVHQSGPSHGNHKGSTPRKNNGFQTRYSLIRLGQLDFSNLYS